MKTFIRPRIAPLSGALLLLARPASACPYCRKGVAEAVWAGIVDEGFGFNLSAMLLPFAIILGLVAAIHFGLPALIWPLARSGPLAKGHGGRHG